MRAIGQDHSVDEWLSLIMEFGQINFKCMELLDEANTSAFGHPVPTKVSMKGNFGTAWQNQQREFDNLPAPILYTANCIMPSRESYAGNIYTTAVVGFPGLKHIPETGGKKTLPLV